MSATSQPGLWWTFPSLGPPVNDPDDSHATELSMSSQEATSWGSRLGKRHCWEPWRRRSMTLPADQGFLPPALRFTWTASAHNAQLASSPLSSCLRNEGQRRPGEAAGLTGSCPSPASLTCQTPHHRSTAEPVVVTLTGRVAQSTPAPHSRLTRSESPHQYVRHSEQCSTNICGMQ